MNSNSGQKSKKTEVKEIPSESDMNWFPVPSVNITCFDLTEHVKVKLSP
jgi:hypothetical protein